MRSSSFVLVLSASLECSEKEVGHFVFIWVQFSLLVELAKKKKKL